MSAAAAATDSSTSSSDPFAVGSIVLASYNDQYYEAKILKKQSSRGTAGSSRVSYFVHYQGWNCKFDEWTEAARILVDNTENREIMKKKKLEAKPIKVDKKAKKEVKTAAAAAVAATEENPKKRVRRELENDETVELDEQVEKSTIQFEFKLPGVLKQQLIKDWETVTRKQQMISLPRRPSVRDLLTQFAHTNPRLAISEFKSLGLAGDATSQSTLTSELNQALINYFDRSCGLMLLYRCERPQFEDFVLVDNAAASEVYGAEHLLRLFIKLPQMMSQSRRLRESDIKLLQVHVNELLIFLGQKHSLLFGNALYEPADEIYLKRVQA